MHHPLTRSIFATCNMENLLRKVFLLVLSTYAVRECLALAETEYNSKTTASRTVNELDDIFKLLRGKHQSITDDGSNWSDVVDSWITNVEDGDLLKTHGLAKNDLRTSITRDSMWKVWKSLRTGIRELVIKKLYPGLIPSGYSNSQNWRLHCADAYKLCMSDNNCFWKYQNFMSSCSAEDLSVLAQVENTKRTRRARRSHTRQSGKRTGFRKGMKRDVQEVERRMNKERRALRRNSQTKRQQSVFWMGQYFVPEKYRNKDYISRYFSMKTRSNKCSSECVNSLMMLNRTVYGALLAHCDCRVSTMPLEYVNAQPHIETNDFWETGPTLGEYTNNSEETCIRHQKMAQTCRPRQFRSTSNVIGCTEVRRNCERNSNCKNAQAQFLSRCSQVINGRRCTSECQESVRKLRQATKHYDTCVCDSGEGPTCRQIRRNVVQLCDVKNIPFKLADKKEQSAAEHHDDITISESKAKATQNTFKRNNKYILNNSTRQFKSSNKRTLSNDNGRNSSETIFQFLSSIILTLSMSAFSMFFKSFST